MVETWKAISGFDGKYEVSDRGKVRNVISGKLVSQWANHKGYQRVTLSGRCDKHHIFVHRLVAEAFIGPIREGYEVNHKDCNKGNNYLANLEIVTRSENQKHAIRNGRGGMAQAPGVYFGEANGKAKLTWENVEAIRREYVPGVVQQKDLAARYGVHPRTIRHVLSGDSWANG